VKDPQVLRMVKNCSPGFYGDAPAAIIAGIEAEEWIEATPSRQVVSILDIGFAAENLILTAQALGIGSCPIASFNVSCIKSVLQAPSTFHPVLVFSLGYPLKIPVSPPKVRFEDIVYLDTYGVPWHVLED
jgi:nitroreductase